MSAAVNTASPPGSVPGEGVPLPAQAAAASDPAASRNSEPPKKKQKPNRTSLGKVRGRRGALKAFNSLPLDLVFDICSYLDPADLYVLSNTSKVFRAVVTGPSSAQLWIDARARVGLPELQLPMTDLQYAALLFGRGCQFCERKNAGKPEVYFRARICSACLKSECVLRGLPLARVLIRRVLISRPPRSFVSPETAKGRVAIQKILPRDHVGTTRLATPTNPHAREGRLVYLPQLLKLDEELQEAFPEADYTDAIFLETLLLDPRYGPSLAGQPATPFQQWVVEKWYPARDARLAVSICRSRRCRHAAYHAHCC